MTFAATHLNFLVIFLTAIPEPLGLLASGVALTTTAVALRTALDRRENEKKSGQASEDGNDQDR